MARHSTRLNTTRRPSCPVLNIQPRPLVAQNLPQGPQLASGFFIPLIGVQMRAATLLLVSGYIRDAFLGRLRLGRWPLHDSLIVPKLATLLSADPRFLLPVLRASSPRDLRVARKPRRIWPLYRKPDVAASFPGTVPEINYRVSTPEDCVGDQLSRINSPSPIT